MIKYLLFIILITPSLALAFDGVFVMKNMQQRKYVSNSDSSSSLYFTIKASERIEYKGPNALKWSSQKSTARNVLEYKQGSLSFVNQFIKFKSAYFYRGTFYMEEAKGVLNGKSFIAREIAFDTISHTLNSDHIILASDRKFSVRKYFKIPTSQNDNSSLE